MKKALLSFSLTLLYTGCTTHIYLVRHAERLDNSPDSPLSEAGLLRAQILRDTLIDEDIHRIFASTYTRTQQTARPLADSLAVPITLYRPDTTDGLLKRLLRLRGENVLVVGHSDNIPQLVRGLCGETVSISHDDYDQLFFITITHKMRTYRSLQQLTYGPPSP